MKETSHFSCILSREQQEGDRVVLTCWVETLVKYIHESFLAVFSAGNSRKGTDWCKESLEWNLCEGDESF